MSDHPWMTFFLISGAVSTLGTIVVAIAAPKALGIGDKQNKLATGLEGVGAVDFES